MISPYDQPEQPTQPVTARPSNVDSEAVIEAEAEAIADKAEKSLLMQARAFLSAAFGWIILPLVAVLLIHAFIFQPYHVVGSSMVPALHESNYLIVSKIGQFREM